MFKNKFKKYMAVALSMLLVMGSINIYSKTAVKASDKKPEFGGEVDLILPTGGLGEPKFYYLDDSEAAKVPSMGTLNAKVRSTTEETIFEKGTGDYGYKSLNKTRQSLYNKIAAALTAFEKGTLDYNEITLPDGESSYSPFSVKFNDLGISQKEAPKVWIAFMADHPWLFWLENGCAVSSTDLMPIVRKSYWGERNDDITIAQKRKITKDKIEKEIKEYLGVADYYNLAYDKAREMDEMIIRKVDFAFKSDGITPEEADWAHTIEGVFDGEHNAVVGEGYAKAFAFLLNILDIPNVYVTGYASISGKDAFHAWNCVSFDNGETYYYMDLTGDDMGSNDSRTGNSYLYFAMPKSKFDRKHHANTFDNDAENWLYDLPKLGDDMYYTYFMQYGVYGTNDELSDYDKTREFLARVKALTPNRLSTCVMLLDNVSISYVRDVMELERMPTIYAEEYDMKIWANPLDAYSKGNPNPLFSFETKNLTIDLESETEKNLSIINVSNASGNYVRWHSDNNAVAVVKMPAYTKMEDGAGVTIEAKKEGTAVIRAEGSNGGTMTCKVEVRMVKTPEPTSTPTPTVSPTSTAGVNPSGSTPPVASEEPVVSAPPVVSEEPAVSAPPVASEEPVVSASPVESEEPVVSAPPATSVKPNASALPSDSEKPTVSASPANSKNPDTSKKPSVSGSPVSGSTQKPSPGIATKSPSPNKTSGPAQTQPGRTKSPTATKAPAKKVKLGGIYKNKKTGAEYKVTGTGKSRTVEYKSSTVKSARKITIPSKITLQGKRYKVTGIANQAFAGNNKLKEVSIGKNVKNIGKRAFKGCKKLKKVKIGKNVTSIQDGAFRNCTSLTLVIIPKSVKKIGDNAFRGCKRLKYIGVNTNRLTPDSVGKNAFLGGHAKPRVKTAEKMWKKYAYIFIVRGLSDKGLFVIEPVDLVI